MAGASTGQWVDDMLHMRIECNATYGSRWKKEPVNIKSWYLYLPIKQSEHLDIFWRELIGSAGATTNKFLQKLDDDAMAHACEHLFTEVFLRWACLSR